MKGETKAPHVLLTALEGAVKCSGTRQGASGAQKALGSAAEVVG